MRSILIPLGILSLLLAGYSVEAQVIEEDTFFTSALRRFLDKEDAFYPSVRIAQEYDDNIRLEPGGPKEGSWKTSIAPTVLFEFPGEQTFFRLAYTPTFIYYYTRDDILDINQNAIINIQQNLTPRNIIGLEDIFIRKEDPEDIRPQSGVPQRNADYNRNHLTLAYKHKLTRQNSFFIKYRNERDDYDKGSALEGLDYWSNNGEFHFRYQPNPHLQLESFYRYRVNDYDTYGSDYRSHLIAIELNYQVGKDFLAKLEGGYEGRYYQAGRWLKSPYAKLKLKMILNQYLEIELKYWYKIEDTFELTYLGYQGQGINALMICRVSPKIFLTLSSLSEFAYFPSSLDKEGEKVSAKEVYLRPIINLTYEIKKDLLLECGYIYTDNDSDFENASYLRNQVYLRINIFL